ncbi:hypothetical protein BgiBS90_003733 [Biomphalaria glabrata]|nr:hypothetical protein BgiBS90_003733 [Biomphalaria glabrata]
MYRVTFQHPLILQDPVFLCIALLSSIHSSCKTLYFYVSRYFPASTHPARPCISMYRVSFQHPLILQDPVFLCIALLSSIHSSCKTLYFYVSRYFPASTHPARPCISMYRVTFQHPLILQDPVFLCIALLSSIHSSCKTLYFYVSRYFPASTHPARPCISMYRVTFQHPLIQQDPVFLCIALLSSIHSSSKTLYFYVSRYFPASTHPARPCISMYRVTFQHPLILQDPVFLCIALLSSIHSSCKTLYFYVSRYFPASTHPARPCISMYRVTFQHPLILQDPVFLCIALLSSIHSSCKNLYFYVSRYFPASTHPARTCISMYRVTFQHPLILQEPVFLCIALLSSIHSSCKNLYFYVSRYFPASTHPARPCISMYRVTFQHPLILQDPVFLCIALLSSIHSSCKTLYFYVSRYFPASTHPARPCISMYRVTFQHPLILEDPVFLCIALLSSIHSSCKNLYFYVSRYFPASTHPARTCISMYRVTFQHPLILQEPVFLCIALLSSIHSSCKNLYFYVSRYFPASTHPARPCISMYRVTFQHPLILQDPVFLCIALLSSIHSSCKTLYFYVSRYFPASTHPARPCISMYRVTFQHPLILEDPVFLCIALLSSIHSSCKNLYFYVSRYFPASTHPARTCISMYRVTFQHPLILQEPVFLCIALLSSIHSSCKNLYFYVSRYFPASTHPARPCISMYRVTFQHPLILQDPVFLCIALLSSIHSSCKTLYFYVSPYFPASTHPARPCISMYRVTFQHPLILQDPVITTLFPSSDVVLQVT